MCQFFVSESNLHTVVTKNPKTYYPMVFWTYFFNSKKFYELILIGRLFISFNCVLYIVHSFSLGIWRCLGHTQTVILATARSIHSIHQSFLPNRGRRFFAFRRTIQPLDQVWIFFHL